jgi:uncharacterized protein (TIGR03083 family)
VSLESTSVSGSPVVALLVVEWGKLDELLTSLDAGDWSRSTALPHWTVQDVVAHLIGTESSLAGIEPPESSVDLATLDYVHNEIGAANERWVQGLRSKPPEEMLADFRDITQRRARALGALSADDLAAPSWTPVGPGTYERFMQIRLFDCWIHEQDIRSAVGQPGHDDGPCAEASVDEIGRALGYIIGKKVGVADGLTVTIELTGPVRRTFHIVVDGRARLVPTLDRAAAATVRLPSGLFVDLAGGRTIGADHRGDIVTEGDEDLANRLVAHLAFTI